MAVKDMLTGFLLLVCRMIEALGVEVSRTKSVCTACDGSRGVKGVDYHESYLGTAPMSDIRRFDVLAMQCGGFTFEDDWSMAYTQTEHGARPDGEPSYVSPAVGVRVFDELTGRPKNRKLMQYLYGEKEAGFGHTRAA